MNKNMLRLNNRQSTPMRLGVGYVSHQQRNNNVAIIPNYKVDMKGDGILDMIRGAYNKAKQAGSYLSSASSSQTAKNLINLLPDSDDTARPGFAGENHAILKLKNGKFGVANYMG